MASRPRSTFGKRFPARNSAAVKALAAGVRKMRKAKGWTQDELAAEVGIAQDAVSMIENGRANPTLIMIEQIARALGAQLADLLETPARSSRSKG
jgi:transcriptional regulator with XRE-family HTH domain